jgi:hypothetical protein
MIDRFDISYSYRQPVVVVIFDALFTNYLIRLSDIPVHAE